MAKTAIGFRAHTGWAATVIVERRNGTPAILDRRRIELTDGVPESRFVYHSVEKLTPAKAAAHVDRCRKSTWSLALRGLQDIRESHAIDGGAILLAAGKPLPDLPGILASHALIHTAEGEFFRQAIFDGAAKLQLPLRGVKERELLQTCETKLGLSKAKLEKILADWRGELGSPWSQDQKYAALAAWLVLDSR